MNTTTTPEIQISSEEFLSLWSPIIARINRVYTPLAKIVEPIGEYEGRMTIRISPPSWSMDSDYVVEISTIPTRSNEGICIDLVIPNYEGEGLTYYEEGMYFHNTTYETLKSIEFLEELLHKLY